MTNIGILAVQDTGTCPMCDMMMGMGWWGILLMALFWILVLGGVGWLIYRLVGSRGTSASQSSPDEILRERYARGEIDGETYHRMREDLRR